MNHVPSNRVTAKRKARKGFSLVELVVVVLIIAILALAVFAGGSAVIKKSQISRTTSDLHNFSVAVETLLNENPGVANVAASSDLTGYVTKLNDLLPADYALDKQITAKVGANIDIATVASTVVYESKKTDAWDNHYYVIFDFDDRNTSKSEFYVTVVSAGPDAKTTLCGTIGADDVFLLGQYADGDVAAVTYNMGDTVPLIAGGSDPTADKASTYATPATAPVNFS